MPAKAYRFALITIGFLLWSSLSFGQTSIISGKVAGEDGQPLKGALIKIERLDIKGNYKVKTNKKGSYLHAGLPLGMYSVTLNVNGKDVDQVRNIKLTFDTREVDFDLAKVAARQKKLQQQAATGQVSQEQLRGMSPDERKKYEAALKKRREQLGKNKKLNETFNAGMEALQAKNYPGAITSLTAASEIDPDQPAIWANLAEAQSKHALSKTGDARKQAYDDGIGSYRQAIALQPENASFYNNLGLILVRAGRGEEGQAELRKAAELDPANGGKYYFNLGAIMINTGNNDGAIEAFKRAVELDPNYAPAHYQLGTALVGAAQMNEDGSVKPVPGTIEAFQKYLELEPNGAMAAPAQSMIASLQGSVETEFKAAKKKKKKRKK